MADVPKRSTVASQSALSAVADVGRPNTWTWPASGSVAPVTRLMEHVGRRLIKTEEGHVFAAGHGEPLDAKRPKTAIVPGDAVQVEDGGHAPRRRFTSSTMRLDSARAEISIFMA